LDSRDRIVNAGYPTENLRRWSLGLLKDSNIELPIGHGTTRLGAAHAECMKGQGPQWVLGNVEIADVSVTHKIWWASGKIFHTSGESVGPRIEGLAVTRMHVIVSFHILYMIGSDDGKARFENHTKKR
jgi:hypothetical protein